MNNERDKDGSKRFSIKTLNEYFKTFTKVVRWAVDDNGNQVHSRTWNLAFIGLPTVDKKKQHRLTLTGEEMTQLVANTAPPYQMEAALLAGSDVHEGDAEDASPDDSSPKAFDDIVTMRRLG